jgi:NAD(P)-dependent dehydrogenase (short-subunit alcohol dehydrogenase family)
MRLDNKVAVITGAGSGLGRVSAELFAGRGAAVVVADVDEARAKATVEAITAAGGEAMAVRCDVRSGDQVRLAIETTLDRHGRLDIMFNNAGISVPGNGKVAFEDLTEEDHRRVLDVNVMGVVFGCQHAVPALRSSGGGVILNTSSAAALVGYRNFATYAASKGAINALTRNLALDLGPYGIRVNALCPAVGMSANFLLEPGSPQAGSYEEQRPDWDPEGSAVPLHVDRPPSVLDNAHAALFLVADESLYISGACLPVDGGKLSQVPSVPKAATR